MVGANAADLYGFDLEALAPIAARVGPTVGRDRRPDLTRRDTAGSAALSGVRRHRQPALTRAHSTTGAS